MLKRLMLSGPYTLFSVRNCVIGAISLPFRIFTWFSVSGLIRYFGSAWIITRYSLPKRLKFDAYRPP